MKWTLWRGIFYGFFLNLFVGLLLLVIIPLEYWEYESRSALVIGNWRFENYEPPLIDLYVSGFIHLGGSGSLLGAWKDYKHKKIEALKPLWNLLPLLLGLGFFFGITGPLYLLFLGGVVVVSVFLGPNMSTGYIREVAIVNPLHLLGSPVSYFLLLVCLILGVLLYLSEFYHR